MSCSGADAIASGDRSGNLSAWQLQGPGKAVWAKQGAHIGHVTALFHMADNACFASGATRPCISRSSTVLRARSVLVFAPAAHLQPVSQLTQQQHRDLYARLQRLTQQLCCSGGQDGCLKIWDSR